MASSEFNMSEHHAAVLKKFQGNGWTLTCSPGSESELSAMFGEAASATKKDEVGKSLALDQPTVRYESDWADTVLDRSTHWRDEEDRASAVGDQGHRRLGLCAFPTSGSRPTMDREVCR